MPVLSHLSGMLDTLDKHSLMTKSNVYCSSSKVVPVPD